MGVIGALVLGVVGFALGTFAIGALGPVYGLPLGQDSAMAVGAVCASAGFLLGLNLD